MATMTARFLPDGSVKLEISGEVEATIHDAVEADLVDLEKQLGDVVARGSLDPQHEYVHSHGGHQHVHAGGKKS